MRFQNSSLSSLCVCLAMLMFCVACKTPTEPVKDPVEDAKKEDPTKAEAKKEDSVEVKKPPVKEADMSTTPSMALNTVKLKQATTQTIDTADLKTQLTLVPGTSLTASGPNTLRFIVQNPGSAARTFCDYHTPFEGVRNSIFEVKDSSGNVIDYRGKMAKRAAPDQDDFWTVPAGSQVQVDFDLGSGYQLAAGTYTIRFEGNSMSGLPASPAISITIK